MTMRLFHVTILTIGVACAASAQEAAQGSNLGPDLGPDLEAGLEAEFAATDRRAPAPPTTTGKERLGEKWTDEQRVDNCGVPPERRGDTPRPDRCASGARD